MKKSMVICLFFLAAALFANDYKWELVNAFTKDDYSAVERIINQYAGSMHAQDKRVVMNFALTYSRGETTLKTLNLLQSHNILPGAFDLYTAVDRMQSDAVINFILGHGARANGEILLAAMEKQKFEIAKQFILSGADVNYQYPLSRSYSDGMSALLYASKYNNFELVQLLADRGANINARNREGHTALSLAQHNGNTQIFDFLTDRGANQTGTNPSQNRNQQNQGQGIVSLMDNTQTLEFLPGAYRLSRTSGEAAREGNRDLRFTGNANYGNISFTSSNRNFTGTYQSANGNLILIMDGRAFTYKIDSGVSFSGNGEVWVRTGN